MTANRSNFPTPSPPDADGRDPICRFWGKIFFFRRCCPQTALSPSWGRKKNQSKEKKTSKTRILAQFSSVVLQVERWSTAADFSLIFVERGISPFFPFSACISLRFLCAALRSIADVVFVVVVRPPPSKRLWQIKISPHIGKRQQKDNKNCVCFWFGFAST